MPRALLYREARQEVLIGTFLELCSSCVCWQECRGTCQMGGQMSSEWRETLVMLKQWMSLAYLKGWKKGLYSQIINQGFKNETHCWNCREGTKGLASNGLLFWTSRSLFKISVKCQCLNSVIANAAELEPARSTQLPSSLTHMDWEVMKGMWLVTWMFCSSSSSSSTYSCCLQESIRKFFSSSLQYATGYFILMTDTIKCNMIYS